MDLQKVKDKISDLWNIIDNLDEIIVNGKDHDKDIVRNSVCMAKEIRDEAIAELEKPAEDAENIDYASWDFMSVTEMDEGFPERRERMKILIGRRDEKIRESYHAKKCAECKNEH